MNMMLNTDVETEGTLFTIYLARVLAHNLYNENFMSFIRTEDLEGIEIAQRNNFVRIERHGVVVVDYSQYMDVYNRITNYVFRNAPMLIHKYNIPPYSNYEQITRFIIDRELNKRIQ